MFCFEKKIDGRMAAELAMPPKATVADVDKFGLFMLKAVPDGRAGELIDLAKVNLAR